MGEVYTFTCVVLFLNLTVRTALKSVNFWRSHRQNKVAPFMAHGVVNGSLRPRDSSTQTASRSVQPLLRSSLQSVPILYNRPPSPHQNRHFSWGSGPMIPLAHPSPQLKTESRLVHQLLYTAHCRVSLYFTMGCPFPSKLSLPMGDLGPQLMHSSLGQPESSTQMASWSVQSFLQGSLL